MRNFLQSLGLISICLVLTSVGCMRTSSNHTLGSPKIETSSGLLSEIILPQFKQGIEFLERGKINAAKTTFENLRNDYPHISVFHHNLGIA